MKEAHLLILKHQPEGQASNLTHTSGSLLEYSPGTETGGCHLCTLPLPCSRAPVSPGRELLHASAAQIFVAAAKGMHLNRLALEARGVCVAVPWDCNN